jgi:hypothetical protein
MHSLKLKINVTLLKDTRNFVSRKRFIIRLHKKIITLRRRRCSMPFSRAQLIFGLILLLLCPLFTTGQTRYSEDDFGPVVRAYLGYLKNEQEVVDDRVSRREISPGYYRRNSNRIRALRQIAVRLARETQNDYLPELEAVTADEFGLLFGRPTPAPTFKPGEVIRNTFRFLGTVRSSEIFYVFARLDPYEQADLTEKGLSESKPAVSDGGPKTLSRSRRVVP